MELSLGRLVVIVLTALAVVTVLALPLYAEIYRWVDENGVTHFSDQKPSGIDAGKEETVDPSQSGSVSVLEGVENKPSATEYIKELLNFGEKKDINRNSTVVIYTTPTWPYCKQALEFLGRNGIQYTNYNVRQDAAARKRMIKINAKGSVPTALINGKKVVGFSEKTYQKMLSQWKIRM